VDVRARLLGTIRRVHVQEGQFVRAGDLMFSLDDRAERAEVDRMRAQVERSRALVGELERQHARNQALLAQRFVAHNAVDTVHGQLLAARAALGAVQASLRAAGVTAGFATLRAPQSGRVGAIDVHPGALVRPDTALATITQLHPIAVAFSLPESTLSRLAPAPAGDATRVTATVGETTAAGTLRFLDSAVDRQTGTILAKAWFDNPDARLRPGQYVQVRVTTHVLRGAWVIPQASIVTTAEGTFCYVVQLDERVRRVPVRRIHADGSDAVVAGIDGAARIVTNGLQNLQPGARVKLASTPVAEGNAP